MKAIFSILGLLIVVAITGMLVKKQFAASSSATVKLQDGSQVTLPIAAPGATAQQQSQQIQQQIKQSVEASMQQSRPVPDEE